MSIEHSKQGNHSSGTQQMQPPSPAPHLVAVVAAWHPDQLHLQPPPLTRLPATRAPTSPAAAAAAATGPTPAASAAAATAAAVGARPAVCQLLQGGWCGRQGGRRADIHPHRLQEGERPQHSTGHGWLLLPACIPCSS
jgi:hypothetical protein